MYNYSELNAVELSSTKKDYYQIWNELLEVASKLSERWDPTSTNESDPGIVLLKVLTAIADKLNYAIDANTMEAFMPSAAQEASMRKLCEMLGYNMRYYESATTTARITYKGTAFPQSNGANLNITIDQFTNLKDIDGKINYVTLEAASLQDSQTSTTVPCIEGELIICETDTGTVVSMQNLDDNLRYYLPEAQVASNGIFISNILRRSAVGSTDYWEQTDNLNIHTLGSKVYKFGFDSAIGLPYVQFPSDIGTLIADGLQIMFIRSSGAAGNLSVNTLGKMEKPASWSNVDTTGDWLDTAKYSVTNISAAKNGRNPETIDEAYWGYQKTIGTFDTLVSCRDYMNKIYTMETSNTDTTPLVSNVIVSDIRDDINKSYTLCTLKSDGIDYTNKARVDDRGQELISHFDLILYPFKTVKGLDNIYEYRDSFTYNDRNLFEIKNILEECKSLSHQIKTPDENDIVCIKVYFKLDARLSTTYKVSALEAKEIEEAAFQAIYRDFNMRYMSFGDELPFETILKTIQEADPRIKNVLLDDPKMQIVALMKGGRELTLVDGTDTATSEEAAKLYNKLILNNVLAGRVAFFNYNTSFSASLTEVPANPYSEFYVGNDIPASDDGIKTHIMDFGLTDNADKVVLANSTEETFGASGSRTPQVTEIKGEFRVNTEAIKVSNPLTLTANEVIQFRFPSFKTIKTYPAYVNYFASLNLGSHAAYPATMQTLLEFLNGGPDIESALGNGYWSRYYSCYELNELQPTDDPADLNRENAASSNFLEWSPITSWEEKIAFLVEKDPAFMKEVEYTSTTDIDVIQSTLSRAQAEHGMLFVKDNNGKYRSVLREKYDSEGNYISVASLTSGNTSISAVKHFYVNANPSTYMGKYFYLDINDGNFTKFIQAVREANFPHRIDYLECEPEFAGTYSSMSGSIIMVPTKISELVGNDNCSFSPGRPCMEGVYKGINSDLTNVPGKLVDINLKKYKVVTGWDAAFYGDVFNTCFLPRLWGSDCVETAHGHTAHCQTGVGKNAVPETIQRNTEYQLKAGEYILFNYSTSEGQVDGSTIPVNVYYGPGTIIRPNFELGDSVAVNAKTKFYKTENYGPWSLPDGSVIQAEAVPGMFSFGVQEQVEIREQIKVELDSSVTNIYWELLNEDVLVDDENNINFPFDSITNSYTLQPGEYFYFTDANKQDIAYYGSGTVIKRSPNTKAIRKSNRDNQTTAAQINELGLTDSIPWQTLNLSAKDSAIIIEEYQYINLIEGDTVYSLDLADGAGGSILTNNFVDVPDSRAYYELSGLTTNLPAVSIVKADNTPLCWQVASKLELNLSSSSPQILHAHISSENPIEPDNITADDIIAIDLINIFGRLSELSDQAESHQATLIQTYLPHPEGNFKDIALYANRLVQSASGLAYFKMVDTNVDSTLQCLSFKVCGSEQLTTSSGERFDLNTNADGFTSLTFKKHIKEVEGVGEDAEYCERVASALTLHAAIPEGYFGILSFYNQVNQEYTDTTVPVLTGLGVSITDSSPIHIFNYTEDWWTWDDNSAVKNSWKTITNAPLDELNISKEPHEFGGIYCPQADYVIHYLRPGLNVIAIESSCNLEILAETSSPDVLYFSTLSLVHKALDSSQDSMGTTINRSLNPRLGCYEFCKDSSSRLDTYNDLCEQIRQLDPEYQFLYNAPIGNRSGLDLNYLDESDTLRLPKHWFDTGNINNKFVVTEIDADYMTRDSHISVSKFSRY